MEKCGNKRKHETRRDQEERHNGLGKRHLEGRKPELRKETKKHLMEEGRRKEKEKGHDPTSDPATKEKYRAEQATDQRRRIRKQGETEEATGVRKNGQGRERENHQLKRRDEGSNKRTWN